MEALILNARPQHLMVRFDIVGLLTDDDRVGALGFFSELGKTADCVVLLLPLTALVT